MAGRPWARTRDLLSEMAILPRNARKEWTATPQSNGAPMVPVTRWLLIHAPLAVVFSPVLFWLSMTRAFHHPGWLGSMLTAVYVGSLATLVIRGDLALVFFQSGVVGLVSATVLQIYRVRILSRFRPS